MTEQLSLDRPFSRTILPRDVPFQDQYRNAIDRLGAAKVHQRDQNEPRDILCMDEGLSPEKPLTVRLAGPVPLLARTRIILIEKVKEGMVFRKVFDHERCGALGLNLRALGEEMDINHDKAGAIIAGNFARDLTDASKGRNVVDYGRRLPLTRRPLDRHTGQTIYYDARLYGLDPAHLEELYLGYTVSRGVFGPEAAMEYTGLAIEIAFGSNGLGNELTPDSPLHLVGITKSEKDKPMISDELQKIRNSHGPLAERIKTHVITG